MPESVEPTSRAQNASTLGRRALHGLVWMLAQNVAARAFSIVSQLVLASLLLPAEFGLIGLTYTVTSVAATLTNVGIEDVLMQRQRALRLWTGAAFWIIFGLASLAGVLVVAAAPLAAAAYKAPGLVGLLVVAALAMPINALASVPGMIMRSRMQFGTLAIYGTAEMFAQALMTIVFAWAGLGAYSFVIPAPILAVARTLIFWRLVKSGTSLRPMRKRWKYVVNNTAAIFLTRIIITFINQGDYMVLGLVATQDIVGGYYFGFRLAAQPLWILAGNFSGVIFPALAQLKGDPKRQGAAALKASNLLSFCVMPLAMLQAAAAGPLVASLFGHKWLTSIPIIQLLSIGLAFDAVSWVAGSLLNARGEFGVGLRYLLIQGPLFFLLVTIGARLDQAIGVACGVCAFYAISQPVYVWAVYRRLGIGARAVAMIYLRPTAYAGVAVGLGLLASMPRWFEGNPLLRVLIIGVVGVGIYAGLVRWLATEVWSELRDRATGALRR